MTEAEWLACADTMPMLEFLRGRASDRKRQLFAVASCRRIWHRVPDSRSRQAIDTTERFIEGEAQLEDMEATRQEAEAAQRDALLRRRWDAGENAVLALALAPEWNLDSWPCELSVAIYSSQAAAQFAEFAGKNRKARKANYVRGHKDENAVQCNFLRDIFGNPFRPAPTIERASLSWNEQTVVRLAQTIYADRDLPDGTLDLTRLAVLADALEEAGCTNADILAHCRQPGQHVRGCWVVDLLLGKE
ncbi:MAG: hypothetical protein ACRELF_01530 [Gemmataceae bacterium]